MVNDKIQFRAMQENDIEQMTAIEAQVFSQPWSRKSFEEALSYENLLFVVAVMDETVVGYCGLYMVLEEGNVINVAVKEEFRGRHMAQEMLTFLMEEGAKQNITAFTLEVREHNETALHVYEKLGFESVGIRKNFYEKPIENAIIMWKR